MGIAPCECSIAQTRNLWRSIRMQQSQLFMLCDRYYLFCRAGGWVSMYAFLVWVPGVWLTRGLVDDCPVFLNLELTVLSIVRKLQITFMHSMFTPLTLLIDNI